MGLALKEKQKRLMDFIIKEEKDLLLRIENAVERGEVVPQSQINAWRNEIRIPAYL